MFSLFFARITFRRFFFSAKYTLLRIRQRSLMLGDFVRKNNFKKKLSRLKSRLNL